MALPQLHEWLRVLVHTHERHARLDALMDKVGNCLTSSSSVIHRHITDSESLASIVYCTPRLQLYVLHLDRHPGVLSSRKYRWSRDYKSGRFPLVSIYNR